MISVLAQYDREIRETDFGPLITNVIYHANLIA